MALPPSSEVALYRAAMRDVNTLAQAELVTLWRALDVADAETARDELADGLPAIIGGYHLMAATVAADWYDVMRADAGARRRFDAIIPDQPDAGRAVSLAGWAVGPLFSASPRPDVALSKVSGGLSRVVLDGARETITVSTANDPAKPGWQRIASGGACNYCSSRTGIRITNDVVFSSHDACGCSAVPDW